MKSSSLIAVALTCLLAGPAVCARQAPAPAGSTGQCKDGGTPALPPNAVPAKAMRVCKEWHAAAGIPAVKAAPGCIHGGCFGRGTRFERGRDVPQGNVGPAANATPGGGPGMV